MDIITREEAMSILQMPSMTFNRMRDKAGLIPYHTRKCGRSSVTKYYLRHEIEALLIPPPQFKAHADLAPQPDIFNYQNGITIRGQHIESEYWFVAKDVCDVLSLADASQAVDRLDDDEKLTRIIYGSGQGRQMWLVNESGLYNLIFQSRKPEAKAFRKWVTSEVLPALRKNGTYSMPASGENYNTVNSHQEGEYTITTTRLMSGEIYS